MKQSCVFTFASLFISVAATASAQSTLRVGMVTTLTGPAADYGLSIRNSIELAKQDRPELFKHIEFIYEDAGYETRLAAAAFHKLVQVDKVNLVHTWGLSFCKALAPMAEAAKIPLVAECLDPEAGRGRQYLFRFFNTSDEYMQRQLSYLKARNLNNIALVVSDTAFLEEMKTALTRCLIPGQRIVLEEHVLPTDTDFKTILARIQRSRAETIGVFLSTGQIAQFYKQSQSFHIELPTFGTNWFESLSEVRAAGETMNGAIFVNTAVNKTYIDRYTRTFGNQSSLSFGGPAYEFAILIGELFGVQAIAPSTDEILKELASVQPREGMASGPYRFIDSPEVGKYFQFPVAVKRVRGSGSGQRRHHTHP